MLNARWPFSDADRMAFFSHIDASRDGCQTWGGKPPFIVRPNDRGGYARWRGRPAHVVAWEMARGPIPLDPSTGRPLEIAHSCDTRNCVGIAHLFLATHQQNHADAARKGRKRNNNAVRVKVTDAMVLDWRRRVANGETRESLARESGVVVSTVMKAVAGTGKWGTRKRLPGGLGWTT